MDERISYWPSRVPSLKGIDHSIEKPGCLGQMSVILEEKGHLTQEMRERRYVYRPTVEPAKARRSSLSHLVQTLFAGSATQLVSTLIAEARPTDEELERLIRDARKARRGPGR